MASGLANVRFVDRGQARELLAAAYRRGLVGEDEVVHIFVLMLAFWRGADSLPA